MTDSAIIKQLGLDALGREDINSSGVIPYVERALSVIRKSREPRENLEAAIVDVLAAGGDPEFVELCCNVLSWTTLKARFEAVLSQAVASKDIRCVSVIQHVLEAFSPSWRDDKSDFYGDFLTRQDAI